LVTVRTETIPEKKPLSIDTVNDLAANIEFNVANKIIAKSVLVVVNNFSGSKNDFEVRRIQKVGVTA
jgi:hypothetical protein